LSLPNIANITPEISLTRCETINLLLSSIAMNDLALSHIINAEGEKIQYALQTLPGLTDPASLDEVIRVNTSANQMLRDIIKAQVISQMKLEEIRKLDEKSPQCSNEQPSPTPSPCPPRPCPPKPGPCPGPTPSPCVDIAEEIVDEVFEIIWCVYKKSFRIYKHFCPLRVVNNFLKQR